MIIIIGIPSINFMCRVLCRIRFIVKSIATLPPSAEINSRVLSLILLRCCFALTLSTTVAITAMMLIIAVYTIKITDNVFI